MRATRRLSGFSALSVLAQLGFAFLAHCNNSPPSPEPQTPPSAHSQTETQASPPASANPMPTAANTGSNDSGSSGSSAPTVSAEAMTRLANDSNAFGFDLYQRVRAHGKGNMVLSPASITTALSMAWGGAKGETAEQMKKALHLEGSPQEVMQASGALIGALTDPNRPIKFRVANRLFGEKTYAFEAPYLDATKAAFGAPLESVDFINGFEPARAHINGWVEEQTENRIKDLIPPRGLDKETRLVLVNAIYFLGDWQAPFENEKTKPASFAVGGKSKKDVPTMHREDRLRYTEKDGVKALEIPYKGGNMSMVFVLPNQADGLDALEKSFDNSKLDELVRGLQGHTVRVSLPKFEINPAESLSLGDRLKDMGMTLAFTRAQADFTGIANPPKPEDRLYISKVFHKAFIRVDEKGTEAAAATGTVMMRSLAMPMPQQPVVFNADHPFLFFIRDNASGIVLFNGRVTDPSAK